MKKELKELVYYATQAPSGHNSQPWKFKVKENCIQIFPDYSRALPVVDPDNHALYISLGCALENLLIAAANSGYKTNVTVNTKNPVYIKVVLEYTGEAEESILFREIEERQSTRNLYNGETVPKEHLYMMQAAAELEDTRCIVLGEQESEGVIDLVKEACVMQFSNHAFLEELVRWIRFNKFRADIKHDGLYSATTGHPDVPKWFGKFILEKTVSPEKEAKKCEELIRSSSNLVVFVAKENSIENWLKIGRSFQRFALTATALGVHHAHENMPCEELSVRKKLSKLLGLNEEEQPLLLIRIGYSEKMPYSYRRPVEEVIIEESFEMEIT